MILYHYFSLNFFMNFFDFWNPRDESQDLEHAKRMLHHRAASFVGFLQIIKSFSVLKVVLLTHSDPYTFCKLVCIWTPL